MPSLKQMKKRIAEQRAANGEKPAQHSCCQSATLGRHTRTCPNHPRNHARPIHAKPVD